MIQENQREEIINSLRSITTLLEKCNADYRILGSVLVVAYSGRVFRHIGDVDILLDIRSKDLLFRELENNGFRISKVRWFNLSWFEARKPKYLGLTFLLIGDFEKDFFRYRISRNLDLRINNDYLKPTNYNFGGMEFVGIPLSSVIAGIKQSFLNPKRRFERKVLKEEMKREVKIYGNINVYFRGIKLPYVYDLFSFLYNIYGALRTAVGYKYESW